MRQALCVLVLAVCSTACSGAGPYLPDGGRIREVCNNTRTVLPVVVRDSAGLAVSGVTVTALNGAKSVEGVTDGNGRTLVVTEDLGPGVVRLKGKLDARTSSVADVTFTCDSCDCVVTPPSATLTLSDP